MSKEQNKGDMLMDNGEPGPKRPIAEEGPDAEIDEQFLPSGRTWALLPGPRMDNGSIWEAIILDHRTKALAGYIGGRNVLTRKPLVTSDLDANRTGAEKLMAAFSDLIGATVRL